MCVYVVRAGAGTECGGARRARGAGLVAYSYLLRLYRFGLLERN